MIWHVEEHVSPSPNIEEILEMYNNSDLLKKYGSAHVAL